MIQFILNNQQINTGVSPGFTLLDFIRYDKNLTGTKIGCREGDCGACTVLVGEIIDNEVVYRSATSCLMPVANAHGKHIVTIEGINFRELNPVQKAMSDEAATQCGFCTPGFVMSLTGFCLQDKYSDVTASIDGNICRCTGYKSIERAGHRLSELMKNRRDLDLMTYAVENGIVPDYFLTIKSRLNTILAEVNGIGSSSSAKYFVGGGTDLYVQKHEDMVHAESQYLSNQSMKGIYQSGNDCLIKASSTVTDLLESDLIEKIFPDFPGIAKLISSTPIRNMATIGGNFVNASPIGDFTVFFLALDAKIVLADEKKSRELSLRDFYKGYKSLDKTPAEYLKEIRFVIPSNEFKFNFEKVSKRTNLDIASVNSAMAVFVMNGKKLISISAGGVGPVPMYLKKTSQFLSEKNISIENVKEACRIAAGEISPISDVRGSAEYKSFLLQQLIKAHLIRLFPEVIRPEKILVNEEY